MPDDSTLIGDGHDDFSVLVENDALAGEAAFESRIDRSVNEIFLFVRNLFQKIVALLNVNMASRAGTHAAAVVVEMHVGNLGDFQN